MVNAVGLASLAGTQVGVGFELAGQRVTLRMDGTQMTVISHDSAPLRTMPCPVPPRDRHRLRGARRASISPPPPAGPVTVQRRVSQRGQIMVATQRIHVGMIHARKIVTVTAGDRSFRLDIDGETVAVIPRTTQQGNPPLQGRRALRRIRYPGFAGSLIMTPGVAARLAEQRSHAAPSRSGESLKLRSGHATGRVGQAPEQAPDCLPPHWKAGMRKCQSSR